MNSPLRNPGILRKDSFDGSGVSFFLGAYAPGPPHLPTPSLATCQTLAAGPFWLGILERDANDKVVQCFMYIGSWRIAYISNENSSAVETGKGAGEVIDGLIIESRGSVGVFISKGYSSYLAKQEN